MTLTCEMNEVSGGNGQLQHDDKSWEEQMKEKESKRARKRANLPAQPQKGASNGRFSPLAQSRR